MKTASSSSLKDNVASATLLAATFFAIMGSIVTSNDVHANKAAPQMETQRMETIIITAPRIQQVVKLETIVVTASRQTEGAPQFLIASK